jgi:hypothetical protein
MAILARIQRRVENGVWEQRKSNPNISISTLRTCIVIPLLICDNIAAFCTSSVSALPAHRHAIPTSMSSIDVGPRMAASGARTRNSIIRIGPDAHIDDESPYIPGRPPFPVLFSSAASSRSSVSGGFAHFDPANPDLPKDVSFSSPFIGLKDSGENLSIVRRHSSTPRPFSAFRSLPPSQHLSKHPSPPSLL